MIDPATKPEGEEYLAYNRRRWGSDGWTQSLRSKGQKVGAPFADWRTWPNTLNAHRLMLHASILYPGRPSLQHQLKGALFEACYEKGENISDLSCLVAVAEACEMDVASARSYLQSHEGKDEVVRECRKASSSGVSGVPYFYVNGDAVDRPYGFSGAVGASQLVRLFEEVSGCS